MIKMLRIDDRLIHGQIAVVWTKELGVDRIVVANDGAAKNDIQKATLKMAAPSTVKCNVMTVSDACEVLADPRSKSMKVLVLVNTTTDARKICESVRDVAVFNVGNYVIASSGKKKIADTFYVDDADVENLHAIAGLGITSTYQLVPSIAPKSIETLLQETE